MAVEDTKIDQYIIENTMKRCNFARELVLLGSAFEIMVWKGLLSIPAGQTSTYSALAAHLGRPQAARAIGSAIGRNPLALLIPCHRVVGRNGALTGYHWGLACKQALLDWESGAAQLRD